MKLIITKQLLAGEKIPEGFIRGKNLSQEAREKMSISIRNAHRFRSKQLKDERTPIIKEQYEFYKKYGWVEFVKKYDYKRTRANFIIAYRTYLFGKERKKK